MLSRSLLSLLLFLGLCGAWAPDAWAEISLEVKNLSVDFPSKDRIRVRGQLRCVNLRPGTHRIERAHGSNHVDVNVDFPHGKRGFNLLPEAWTGLETKEMFREDDRRWGWKPYYEYEGRRYRQGQKVAAFYNGTYLRWSPVLDRPLDDTKDDGRWIAFDKTLPFKAPAAQYRIVFGRKYATAWGRFGHTYLWVVYGPFAWGKAPACTKTLRATERRPASFTSKGVVIKKPVGDPLPDEPSREEKEEEKKKRPKPKRTGERPSQLMAANASEKLGNTLEGWKGIKTAGARANLFVARVEFTPAATIAGEARTALVARVAVEAAHSYPWGKTIEVVLREGQKSTVATIPWDAAANFAANEITLEDFHALWKVTGGTLPAPKPPAKTSAKAKAKGA